MAYMYNPLGQCHADAKMTWGVGHRSAEVGPLLLGGGTQIENGVNGGEGDEGEGRGGESGVFLSGLCW